MYSTLLSNYTLKTWSFKNNTEVYTEYFVMFKYISCKLNITKWHAIQFEFSFKLELHFYAENGFNACSVNYIFMRRTVLTLVQWTSVKVILVDMKNKDCFCIGYNSYVIEKAQVCGTCIFSISMYNFCKLKITLLITVIIHEAHVGLTVNTINNTDSNVIETGFHNMFSVRCEFQVKLWKYSYKLT